MTTTAFKKFHLLDIGDKFTHEARTYEKSFVDKAESIETGTEEFFNANTMVLPILEEEEPGKTVLKPKKSDLLRFPTQEKRSYTFRLANG